MTQLILQPSGGKDADIHYENTVIRPVLLSRIRPFITDIQYLELSNLAFNDEVAVWGVTPSANGVNIKKWNRIQSGDVALFGTHRVAYASSIVLTKVHNRQLAIELWGERENGETWEYIYFLGEVTEQAIPKETINRLVGYEPNYNWMGFNVLPDEKSIFAIEELQLRSEITTEPIDENEFESTIRKLTSYEGTDIERRLLGRREQGFLRKYLFDGKETAVCSICGGTFPIQYMVAAHIKKRSLCTEEERLDYQHVVAPMCRLGCDELYERKAITVLDGHIHTSEPKNAGAAIHSYLEKIEGNYCEAWNENTRRYFKAHAG